MNDPELPAEIFFIVVQADIIKLEYWAPSMNPPVSPAYKC